jgi:hypothetical protein
VDLTAVALYNMQEGEELAQELLRDVLSNKLSTDIQVCCSIYNNAVQLALKAASTDSAMEETLAGPMAPFTENEVTAVCATGAGDIRVRVKGIALPEATPHAAELESDERFSYFMCSLEAGKGFFHFMCIPNLQLTHF